MYFSNCNKELFVLLFFHFFVNRCFVYTCICSRNPSNMLPLLYIHQRWQQERRATRLFLFQRSIPLSRVMFVPKVPDATPANLVAGGIASTSLSTNITPKGTILPSYTVVGMYTLPHYKSSCKFFS